ncbi:MAG: internal scaffolding protein [Arizlama microvirus]|nr:MAG: internal scaffolding protein [Arizlama microvirus]
MDKLKVPFMRTPYNYDTNAASNESGLACEEPSLAQQHFAEECDINNILRQFNITGLLPEAPLSPRYGDFSGITDYHTALNAVIAAEDGFMALPADLRARFQNDPENLINFLDDEANKDEAIKLGLIDQKLIENEKKIEAEIASQGD